MGRYDDDRGDQPTKAECDREAYRSEIRKGAREEAINIIQDALTGAIPAFLEGLPAEGRLDYLMERRRAFNLGVRKALTLPLMATAAADALSAFITECAREAGYGDTTEDCLEIVKGMVGDSSIASDMADLLDEDDLEAIGAWDAAKEVVDEGYEYDQFCRDHAPGRV